MQGKFKGAANPKDGFAVADCINMRNRRLLVGNTVFGALSKEKRVDWAKVISGIVTGLISNVGKSRATPICPYLFHLYKKQGLLTLEENKEWRVQMALLKFGGSNDEGFEVKQEDSPVQEAENSRKRAWIDEDEEEEELEIPLNRKKSKYTPNLRGSPSEIAKGKESEVIVRAELVVIVEPVVPKKLEPLGETKVRATLATPLTDLIAPFNDLIRIFDAVRADWKIKNTMLYAVADLVRGKVGSALPEAVANCISNPDVIRELEEWVAKQNVSLREMDELALRLRGEIQRLRKELKIGREQVKATRSL